MQRPKTEWELKSPETRHAIIHAPFITTRIPGKTWAGTIVVDETDDPVLRHYKQVARQEMGDVTRLAGNLNLIDNVFRTMEG